MQKITFCLLLALAPFLGLVTQVYAEELVISENGSGSQNQVQSEQSAAVNVSQDNTAAVDNTVAVAAETGNNTTSDNTNGDTGITTGDVSVATEIINATNGSVATSNCCAGGSGAANITGNGKDSTNSISFKSTYGANAVVTNTSTIHNTINGYANTGNNKANGNTGGSVSITTGNIHVSESIKNNANASYVSLPSFQKDYLLHIAKNGAHSENTITDDVTNSVVIAVNNHANIFNNSFWELVTGNIEANDNNGNVAIKTGDIHYESEIVNNANLSVAVVTCCPKDEHKPEAVVPPEKPLSPKPVDNGGNGGNSSNGGKGDSLGAAIQNVLPVTGNMWFFLALIGNLALLIFGTYMRLRSGRSPALVIA